MCSTRDDRYASLPSPPNEAFSVAEPDLLEPGTEAYDSWNTTCYALPQYPAGWLGGRPFEDLDLVGYGEGGYLAIHLGDLLKNRYKVVHKLGNGRSATVWLCRDTRDDSWKAVRVLTSEASAKEDRVHLKEELEGCTDKEIEDARIILSTDEFRLEGYNGSHRCLVFPFWGPPLSHIWYVLQEDPDHCRKLREICQQAVEAMSFLHSKGLCHGDFRPENILIKLKGVDKLNDREMIEVLSRPQYDDEAQDSYPLGYPKYTVSQAYSEGVHWHEHIGTEIGIIGFEDSFKENSPPEDLRTPMGYAAPEILFPGVPGFASDVWALACTIWKIRTGFQPFRPSHQRILESAVWHLEYFLGPLPEPYKTAWGKCDNALKNSQLEDGALRTERLEMIKEHERDKRPYNRLHQSKLNLASSYGAPSEDGEIIEQEKWPDRRQQPYCTTDFNERVLKFSGPFAQELAKDWRACRRDPPPGDPDYDDEVPTWIKYTWRMPDEEIPLLAGLVSKVWKYNPMDRAKASELLEHEWFKPHTKVNQGSKRKRKHDEIGDSTEDIWSKRLRPR
ncbi:kinase-like domain-containing protein [Xylariaceae sp. FL0662B]|nr:kinase-like domain-containing protein [Xylariaceae sp. FL0662B]